MKKLFNQSTLASIILSVFWIPNLLQSSPIGFFQDIELGYKNDWILKQQFSFEPSPLKGLRFFRIISDDTTYYNFEKISAPYFSQFLGKKLRNTYFAAGIGWFVSGLSSSAPSGQPLKSSIFGISTIIKLYPYSKKKLSFGIEGNFNFAGTTIGMSQISDRYYFSANDINCGIISYSLVPSLKFQLFRDFSLYGAITLFTTNLSTDDWKYSVLGENKTMPSIDIVTKGNCFYTGVAYNFNGASPNYIISSGVGVLKTDEGNKGYFNISLTMTSSNSTFSQFVDIYKKSQVDIENKHYEKALNGLKKFLQGYKKWNRYGEISSSYVTINELKTQIEFCKIKIEEKRKREREELFVKGKKEFRNEDYSSALHYFQEAERLGLEEAASWIEKTEKKKKAEAERKARISRKRERIAREEREDAKIRKTMATVLTDWFHMEGYNVTAIVKGSLNKEIWFYGTFRSQTSCDIFMDLYNVNPFKEGGHVSLKQGLKNLGFTKVCFSVVEYSGKSYWLTYDLTD